MSDIEAAKRMETIATILGLSVVQVTIGDGKTVFELVPKGPRVRVIVSDSYVGGGFSVEPIEGESWRRGNDLPDGSRTDETWDRLERAIMEAMRDGLIA